MGSGFFLVVVVVVTTTALNDKCVFVVTVLSLFLITSSLN